MAIVKIVRRKTVVRAPKIAKVPLNKPKLTRVRIKGPNIAKIIEEPKLEWKVGASVLSKQCCVTYGDTAEIILAREHEIPYKVYFLESDNVYVHVPDTGVVQGRSVCLRREALQLISDDKAKLLLEIAMEAGRKFREELKAKAELILNPAHVRISDRRDYEILNRDFLLTSTNYLRVGNIDNKLQDGNVGNAHFDVFPSAVCCSLSRTKNDIVVNIPIAWTNYYGYDKNDIKLWIAYLTQCEIEFQAYILEDSTPLLENVFAANVGSIGENLALKNPNKNTYISRTLPTYQIVIKGCRTNPMKTYMYFILIRYLYNNTYWNIPFIAMQIKQGVGEALSFWDCLLLAHLNHHYNGYYALTNNSYEHYAFPSEINSQQRVIRDLKNNGMNSAFEYTRKGEMETVQKLIRNQDYNGIIDLVNEYKNK